ncbi:hypothetical protein C2G38_2177177 [Gigaspora rosea]|uniref:Uncharacterized protein n=1 Tax=Gigaspora rosea TaxID=44941 RepID=A0A397VJS3_9GLOM|nr:hypothetical protein C2G38_2177177 [Gigaspora rosea]
MHLFYENIAKYVFEYWTGTFFSDASQNNEPYVLAKSVWLEIGNQMHSLPEKWAAWITIYSLPLLKGRLPSEYYNE